MTCNMPPYWLEDFQVNFGSVLRRPLDFQSGSLQADLENYPSAETLQVSRRVQIDPLQRLSVYNRQYWFRLFSVMQGEFLLTSRLMGLWQFNQLIQDFLTSHPPQHYDIQHCVDGFIGYLQSEIPSRGILLKTSQHVARASLLKSAELDLAMQKVFLAPEQAIWRPSPIDAQRFTELRLKASQAFVIFEENFPMLKLRESLIEDQGEGLVPLPPPLPEQQSWAIYRQGQSLRYLKLDSWQSRLYQLLAQFPIGQALSRLEEECPIENQNLLQQQVTQWLAISVDHGFWVGC